MDENYVKGTCQTMCPEEEANLRQKENLLHIFEIKKGTENNKNPEYDPKKIVKCFGRSAAGVNTTKPSNLRPFPVLIETIRYLCYEVFPIHKEKPLLVYNYMFDRFRAVRQDSVIQNLSPSEMIEILEPITRFYIYFGFYLVEENCGNFDFHLNNINLLECVKSLLVFYDQCEEINDNRWDIESAYLLYNLGNIKALTRGVKLCRLASNKSYEHCLELSFQWYLKNYVRVFNMLSELSPLLLCIVNSLISEIRKYALCAMSHGYSSANSSYPIIRLGKLLKYESEEEVVNDCKHFNIKVTGDKINFLKKDFDGRFKNYQGAKCRWIGEVLEGCDVTKLLYLGNLG